MSKELEIDSASRAQGTSVRVLYGVVVVAFRSERQLQSLLPLIPSEVPGVIVDNSADLENLAEVFSSLSNFRVIDSSGNVGFARAANIGAEHLDREYLIFVNPDARPSPDDLDRLVSHLAQNPDVASCGPALVDEAGRIQLGGGGWEPSLWRCLVHALGLHLLFDSGVWSLPRKGMNLETDWLAGTCLAIRRETFLASGGFHTGYFMYQEDMELGRVLRRAGWKQILFAEVRVEHKSGQSADVPAKGIWTYRAEALSRYIHKHNRRWRSESMHLVLIGGFLIRAGVYRMMGQPVRVAEMMTYSGILRSSIKKPAGETESDQARGQ